MNIVLKNAPLFRRTLTDVIALLAKDWSISKFTIDAVR
jgi:hypothetical protein